ncbi:MAG: tetratricopeptide repeat protein, partial [Pseudomonadota bacterium]
LVSGLADRAPFGDGNGISTAAEVEIYLTQSLNRRTERDPVCGPRYSVLLKSSNDPNQELVAFKGRSVFSVVETRLYNETFEAQFLLASDSRDDVQKFLASCLYCPNERELTDRLRDMEEFARSSALETEIWTRIQNDETTTRLSIYLDSCTLCTFRDEVEEKIALLNAKAAARDAERMAYTVAVESRDLVSLRGYVRNCVACDFLDEARTTVSEIEADEAYKAEIAALDEALSAEDMMLLKAYIAECEICEGKDRATSTLERVTKRIRLIEPCLQMAAVPQLGGPRQLRGINQTEAGQACTTASAEFPGDGQIEITLGRIAQAAGDYSTAMTHYQAGMDLDEPAAFGLAAYTHYAPPEGVEINLVEAERLAQIGASKGDWLSREILTVLYSKGLVPGRTPEEAFEIAKGIANEGNEMGAYFVGFYYLTGTGVDTDRDAAKIWLQQSVDQGYTHAMAFLAEVYETAEIPNHEKAADLYWAGVKAGDETAIDRLTAQISSRDREVIRAIQQKLSEEGAYRGQIDGIAGPSTVTAVQNYADGLVQEG